MLTRHFVAAIVFGGACACTGLIGEGEDGNPGGLGAGPGAGAGAGAGNATLEAGTMGNSINPGVVGVGKVGARRLTRTEYVNTLHDILGDDAAEGTTYLPGDRSKPFDNDYTTQQASQALVDGAQLLATTIAGRVVADATKRKQLVGCAPSGPDDAVCMRSFVTAFGRKMFRRPLTEQELGEYVAFQSYAHEANDFYVGASLVLQAMLQDPSFLYRTEIGEPVPGKAGLFRLNDWEVATRISYFLWGSTPDTALLDRAAADGLSTPEQVRAAAQAMLDDPRTRERVQRFHGAWLNTDEVTTQTPALTSAMRAETSALVKRVLFEKKGSWLDLFRSEETFANDILATNYGLPKPGSTTPQWISYGTTGRKGILSHGSFLTNGAKFGDTSPTRRGKLIRNRLFCQEIPPPPPNVNADAPPAKGKCKVDRYKAHAAVGTCVGCHSQMDPIGFGLENYGAEGAYRATDMDAPECPISGDGEVAGVGKFKGPGELGGLLVQSGVVEACVVKQLYRFSAGHTEGADDTPYIESLAKKFHDKNQQFDQLLLDVVSEEAFGYRRED